MAATAPRLIRQPPVGAALDEVALVAMGVYVVCIAVPLYIVGKRVLKRS
jgi:hypothetical protein